MPRAAGMFMQTDLEVLDSWWSEKLQKQSGILPLWWSQKVGSIGEIVIDENDIHQAIRIILLTRRRQDIHRPDFASNLSDYLDYPIPSARPHVIRESYQAIGRWEPRVVLDNILVSYPEISQLTMTAEWRLKNNLKFSARTNINF